MKKIIAIASKLKAGTDFILSGKNRTKRARVMIKRFFWPDQVLHVFIEVTNLCNARCITCLQKDMKRKRGTMDLQKFKNLIDIVKKKDVAWVHLYGIGESYMVPGILDYFNYALRELGDNGVDSVLITNGEIITELPKGFKEVFISFNAGKKESYERITGLNFDKTVSNIKRLSKEGQLGDNVVIRMLASDNTKDEVEDFRKIFKDIRCNLEISYKFENQRGEIQDLTIRDYKKIERVPCNYVMSTMNICWNGDVILCPHDFEGEVKYGNIFEEGWNKIVSAPLRKKNITDHKRGNFCGLCRLCNYNVPLADQVKRIKSFNE
jgi:radical SAM protein with 4Fe4S-binding SPASM domain